MYFFFFFHCCPSPPVSLLASSPVIFFLSRARVRTSPNTPFKPHPFSLLHFLADSKERRILSTMWTIPWMFRYTMKQMSTVLNWRGKNKIPPSDVRPWIIDFARPLPVFLSGWLACVSLYFLFWNARNQIGYQVFVVLILASIHKRKKGGKTAETFQDKAAHRERLEWDTDGKRKCPRIGIEKIPMESSSLYTQYSFFFFSPHTGAKKKKKRNRFLHRKGKPMFITREHHLHCILFKSLLISVLFLSFFRVSYQWHNKRVECSCQSPENKEETYPFYAVLRFVFFFSFYFRFWRWSWRIDGLAQRDILFKGLSPQFSCGEETQQSQNNIRITSERKKKKFNLNSIFKLCASIKKEKKCFLGWAQPGKKKPLKNINQTNYDLWFFFSWWRLRWGAKKKRDLAFWQRFLLKSPHERLSVYLDWKKST